MRMHSQALLLLALPALAAGCADKSYALVSVFSTAGQFNDVAALMVFLCGPESGSITGSILPVDGGWSGM